MDRQIELTAVQERRLATNTFYGYRRQRKIPDGCFSADNNMTTDEYPSACSRRPRVEALNTSRGTDPDHFNELIYVPFDKGYKLVDAIEIDGSLAYLAADTADKPLYAFFRDRHWEVGTAAKPDNARLLAYGNGLFSVTRGQYIPNRAVTADNADQFGGNDFPVLPVQVQCSGQYTVTLTDELGNAVTPADAKPETPSPGDYWYDSVVNGLYIYTTDGWIPVASAKVKVVPKQREQDGQIAGETDADFLARRRAFRLLRAGGSVSFGAGGADLGSVRIHAVHFGEDEQHFEEDYAVLDTMLEPGDQELVLQRRYPGLQYAVVSGNRIFGCKYAKSAGDTNVINEIYVSRLGDPLTWYGYNMLEEDSFTFTVGEPGEWTGAAVLNGNPVFFKENCMVTVYGNSPSNYTAVTVRLDGVEQGCDRSLAEIDGCLYYKSRRGVMRLAPGGYPVCISDDLRRKDVWRDAVAGTDGRKYYIEMDDCSDIQDGKTVRKLYVYDARLNIWHIEDATNAMCYAGHNSELLAVINRLGLQGHNAVGLVYVSGPETADVYDNAFQTYLAEVLVPTGFPGDYLMIPPWDAQYPQVIDKRLRETGTAAWEFATGDFGHIPNTIRSGADPADYKRVKEIDVRLYMGNGASFGLDIMYDQDGTWLPLTVSDMTGAEGTRRVSYRLRRCDLYRLRFRGVGDVCVYSISHVYEEAGDRAYGTV